MWSGRRSLLQSELLHPLAFEEKWSSKLPFTQNFPLPGQLPHGRLEKDSGVSPRRSGWSGCAQWMLVFTTFVLVLLVLLLIA